MFQPISGVAETERMVAETGLVALPGGCETLVEASNRETAPASTSARKRSRAPRKASPSMSAPLILHVLWSASQSSDWATYAQATCCSNGTSSISPSRLRAWAIS